MKIFKLVLIIAALALAWPAYASHFECGWMCYMSPECYDNPDCRQCANWEESQCNLEVQACHSAPYPASCYDASAGCCYTDSLGFHTCSEGCLQNCCERWYDSNNYCTGLEFCEDLYRNNDVPPSPIVVSRDAHFQYTPVSVSFDIDADGTLERIGWIDPTGGESLLAMDRNFNGRIDNGAELFGSATPQGTYYGEERNGFIALRELDLSQDGVVSGAELSGVLLWYDDGDANSEPGELVPIEDAGILDLSTKYFTRRGRDRHGNLRRWFGSGDGVHLEDVVFVRGN